MTSSDYNHRYNPWELAERIDKSVDIVTHQEHTIGEQEETIDVTIVDARDEILEAIRELAGRFQPISDEQIDALFNHQTSLIFKRCADRDDANRCAWVCIPSGTNKSLDDSTINYDETLDMCVIYTNTDLFYQHPGDCNITILQPVETFTIDGLRDEYDKTISPDPWPDDNVDSSNCTHVITAIRVIYNN